VHFLLFRKIELHGRNVRRDFLLTFFYLPTRSTLKAFAGL